MTLSKSEHETRQERILDAAASLIMRQGYDKTTMSDVAGEVGVSRGIVYLHFDSKEALFEALFRREFAHYARAWLDFIEADPRGGTVGGIYRAVLHAINSRPLMAAMMRRDRRVVGSYIRKPDNLFGDLQSSTAAVGFIQALQDAGAVRRDVDPALMSHIMDILSVGLLTIQDFRPPEDLPPLDDVMETLAEMLDRLLTPADGRDSEAGKQVIRDLDAAAIRQCEAADQTTEPSAP